MKKILLLILIIFITLLSACGNEVDPPTTNNKTEVKEEFSRVIASSDFQGERGHLNSEENLLEVMAMIEEDGIDSADAFFACGDYDYEFNDSRNGIELFQNAMEYYVNRDNMYFVQGNHDELVPGEDGLNPGGDNDPKDDKFGVFIINEDEYMWYNNNEAIVKNLGYNLQKYLNEKLEENYTKPIFILSHLGLNYNMRTYNDGDGQYAKYIFDVLNEAGEKGLNIIYLFGHNHSNGWDDYLGGASIYLAKGDDILIADNDKYKFISHKLNFTYMNAGYIGYYRDVNEGADTSLTMTVFDIYSDKIVINRYSKDGKHNLKSCGERNDYKNETQYEPNTKVYSSPQEVKINTNIDKSEIDIIENNKEDGQTYIRINSLDELTDANDYLLIYHADSDFIILPEVVEKANSSNSIRIGLNIEGIMDVEDNEVVGNYKDKLWTIKKDNDKWLIGSNDLYLKLTQTDNYSVTATLLEEGSLFTINGSNIFTFYSDGYYLNYNSRGLINGYSSNPCQIYIYKKVS